MIKLILYCLADVPSFALKFACWYDKAEAAHYCLNENCLFYIYYMFIILLFKYKCFYW